MSTVTNKLELTNVTINLKPLTRNLIDQLQAITYRGTALSKVKDPEILAIEDKIIRESTINEIFNLNLYAYFKENASKIKSLAILSVSDKDGNDMRNIEDALQDVNIIGSDDNDKIVDYIFDYAFQTPEVEKKS